MQITSTQLNIETKGDDSVELSRYLNNSKGFTLAELITSIAIIGILAAVGIQQYSQYKIRGYDAHSKQALHDMNLTCKAFWTDNGTSEECDIAKSKEYGFVQHPDVVAAIPSSAIDTFCASAEHNSSPNVYSSDAAGLISDNGDCGLSAKLAAQAETARIAAVELSKKEAELKAAIEKAAREDCCVARAANKNESTGDKEARLAFAGCANLNTVTAEEKEACRVWRFNSEMANRADWRNPDCYKIRLNWLTYSTKSTSCVLENGEFGNSIQCDNGAHASDFDIENPDSECARNF